MLWRYILLLGVVLTIYLCLGGLGFYLIEYNNETNTRNSQTEALKAFLSNYTCVPQEDLDVFLTRLIAAYDSGVLVLTNRTSVSNWNYVSSLFFSLTVVTTIGYGNISPSTQGGQAFFVIYALLGIPLCGAFVFSIGMKLQKPLHKLLSYSCSSKCSKVERYLKICVFTLVSLLILLFGPAAVFMVREEWSYGESLYFCVVTMTTVGFGDYIPGQQAKDYRVTYRILVMVWILVGYAWLAVIISKATDRVVGRVDAKSKLSMKQNKTNAEEVGSVSSVVITSL